MKSPAGGMKSRQEFTVNVGKEDMRILALMMLMVVGCGSERKLTTEEEKVVGTYEVKILDYFKCVVLANGIAEAFIIAESFIGKDKKSRYLSADCEDLLDILPSNKKSINNRLPSLYR